MLKLIKLVGLINRVLNESGFFLKIAQGILKIYSSSFTKKFSSATILIKPPENNGASSPILARLFHAAVSRLSFIFSVCNHYKVQLELGRPRQKPVVLIKICGDYVHDRARLANRYLGCFEVLTSLVTFVIICSLIIELIGRVL